MIHGPAKAVEHSLRTAVIEGGHRIKKAVKPEPSPWRTRFEVIGTIAALFVLLLKARGPKKI
jgi:hypothetical protein